MLTPFRTHQKTNATKNIPPSSIHQEYIEKVKLQPALKTLQIPQETESMSLSAYFYDDNQNGTIEENETIILEVYDQQTGDQFTKICKNHKVLELDSQDDRAGGNNTTTLNLKLHWDIDHDGNGDGESISYFSIQDTSQNGQFLDEING